MKSAITIQNLRKEYKNFKMDGLNLSIPKGLATVLIGSNGAGKTTLLKIMSGILRFEEGMITYNEKSEDVDGPDFKEAMVYVPDTCCFNSFFDMKRVCSLMKLGFDSFDEQEFIRLCKEFELLKDNSLTSNRISTMSTGNQMKLMLCAMLARKGKYLLLDEPAANLDPVMQDLLQVKMRDYLKDEEHTIIYSTHNIEQVHNVADYAIFMCDGKVIEAGLIMDICEKYRIIRGDVKVLEQLSPYLEYVQVSENVFDGLGKTEVLTALHGELDITIEKPELRDLSVYLLKMGRNHV